MSVVVIVADVNGATVGIGTAVGDPSGVGAGPELVLLHAANTVVSASTEANAKYLFIINGKASWTWRVCDLCAS